MKINILLLIILVAFVTSFAANANEARGCRIKEREGKCCWQNNNGCCAPPKPDQVCTEAITECCKIKTYDEETNTYTYKYESK